MDDSTRLAVLETVQTEVAALLEWLQQTPELDVATAEQTTWQRLLVVGAQLLSVGLAARGTGKAGGRPDRLRLWGAGAF